MITLMTLALSLEGQRQATGDSTSASFYPAVYISDEGAGTKPHLAVFPSKGAAFAIPLPFALSNVVFGPDGKALFATAAFNPLAPKAGEPGLFKIELNPVRTIHIPGSTIFGIVAQAISARGDKILISGVQRRREADEQGIFELDPITGQSRLVVAKDAASVARAAVSQWTHLSLSPDGVRIAAMRQRVLEVIDVRTGISRALPQQFELGSWSPDGKWLAVIDWEHDHTVLMDAATLITRATLPQAGVDWSPDSRCLLGVKGSSLVGLLCGPYSGTFQVTDIVTGKAVTFGNSRCKVKGAQIGWINAEALRK